MSYSVEALLLFICHIKLFHSLYTIYSITIYSLIGRSTDVLTVGWAGVPTGTDCLKGAF